MPKVSVITAVYNLQDIVLETIHSILAQTYADLELIVVDDGSTDATAERIEAVGDPRLNLVRADHTGLPAGARRRAFEISRGEFLAVADGDDVLAPERIARQVEFLEKHPAVGIVHSGYHHLLDGQIVPLPPRRDEPETTSAADMLPRLLVNNDICGPTVMLRRSAIERAGGFFDTDPLLCGPEDFELWLRLCEAGVEFGYIPEPLMNYRIRRDSVSRNLLRNWRGNLRAIEKAQARSPELYARHRKLVRERLSSTYRNLGRMKLIEGEPGALADLWRAVQFLPGSARAWGWMVLGLCGHNVARAVVKARDKASVPAAVLPDSHASTV